MTVHGAQHNHTVIHRRLKPDPQPASQGVAFLHPRGEYAFSGGVVIRAGTGSRQWSLGQLVVHGDAVMVTGVAPHLAVTIPGHSAQRRFQRRTHQALL